MVVGGIQEDRQRNQHFPPLPPPPPTGQRVRLWSPEKPEHFLCPRPAAGDPAGIGAFSPERSIAAVVVALLTDGQLFADNDSDGTAAASPD